MLIMEIITATIFLAILSAIDIKTVYSDKKEEGIPSIITTAFIIIMFLMVGQPAIMGGIFALLICLLMIDIKEKPDLMKGEADFKAFIIIGMSLGSMGMILIFTLILMFMTILYQFMVKRMAKKGKAITVVPYIPIMFITYIGFIALFYV